MGHSESVSCSRIPRDLAIADHIYRYPAKMTPKLAISFMKNVMNATDGNTSSMSFYDPMCGSGTTALIARWMGYDVSSSDLMIPSVTIARAKLNCLNEVGINRLIEFMGTSPLSYNTAPLDDWPNSKVWFTPVVLRALQDIRNGIIAEGRHRRYYPHLSVALFQTIWDVSATDKGVIVPTRSSLIREAPRLDPNQVLERFTLRVKRIIGAQQALKRLGFSTSRIAVKEGSALDVGTWPDERPSVVLTSPPYGCGLDYSRALSLQARVWMPEGCKYSCEENMIGRRSHIDTDCASLPYVILRADWFKSLKKASLERYNLLFQYFLDMESFFMVASERMAQDGTLGIVIGNPEMQRIRIPLNWAITVLAEEAGFEPSGSVQEDRIKTRVQNFKLRSATAPIPNEYILTFRNS